MKSWKKVYFIIWVLGVRVQWVLKLYIAKLYWFWGLDALVLRCFGYSILLVWDDKIKGEKKVYDWKVMWYNRGWKIFDRRGKECRHNLAYWNMDNWIGVGSASASYMYWKRIKNISSVEEYINSINEKGEAIEEIINNSKNDNMEEFMFMGLRKINGIDDNEFKNRFS